MLSARAVLISVLAPMLLRAVQQQGLAEATTLSRVDDLSLVVVSDLYGDSTLVGMSIGRDVGGFDALLLNAKVYAALVPSRPLALDDVARVRADAACVSGRRAGPRTAAAARPAARRGRAARP